ncbi:AraC family transcriptional regulator [Paenibacillus sp. R14(2021)]|uniref:AraC family transcriptional regulator n=1 Tax=Paenibacillus sp. R14(2021) TaxID=2859228 RepID=UPI001C615928|nr:AraC family transcriptional regulator [Paenibacillus sp. R14(2021)]
MSNAPVKKLDFLNLAPYVRFIHEYQSDPGSVPPEKYRIPPRVIYDHELIFLLSGACVHHVGGVQYAQKSGDLFFMRPHVEHFSQGVKGEPLHYFALHFDLTYMGEQLDFSADEVYAKIDYQHLDFVPVEEELSERPVVELSEVLFPFLIRPRNSLPYIQLFGEAQSVFSEKPFGYHLLLRSLLLRILSHIVSDVVTNEGVSKDADHRAEITQAIQYMYEHYAEDIDFSTFMHAGELTPNYFRKLFKDATGKTPLELLTSIRLEKAKLLIQEGRHSISKISAMVGYPDIHYFSKLFKKVEGISPKYYAETISGPKKA